MLALCSLHKEFASPQINSEQCAIFWGFYQGDIRGRLHQSPTENHLKMFTGQVCFTFIFLTGTHRNFPLCSPITYCPGTFHWGSILPDLPCSYQDQSSLKGNGVLYNNSNKTFPSHQNNIFKKRRPLPCAWYHWLFSAALGGSHHSSEFKSERT